MAAEPFAPLTVSRLSLEGITVLRIEGELDLAAAPQLRAELAPVTQDEVMTSLTIDLSGVSFIDSTGLQELLIALRQLRERGASMVLSNPRPSAMRLFQLTGMLGVFDVRPASGDAPRPIQSPAS